MAGNQDLLMQPGRTLCEVHCLTLCSIPERETMKVGSLYSAHPMRAISHTSSRRAFRCAFSPANLNPDVHPRSQPVNHRHQAFDADTPKIRVAYAREVPCVDSSKALRGADAQASPVEHFDNRRCQHSLQLPNVRVRQIKIPIDISATAD